MSSNLPSTAERVAAKLHVGAGAFPSGISAAAQRFADCPKCDVVAGDPCVDRRSWARLRFVHAERVTRLASVHPFATERAMQQAHARSTDPQTSHDAARSVDPEALRPLVLDVATELSTFTDPDLYAAVVGRLNNPDLPSSSVRTRRHELVVLGRIGDTGQRQKSAAGRAQTVWGVL